MCGGERGEANVFCLMDQNKTGGNGFQLGNTDKNDWFPLMRTCWYLHIFQHRSPTYIHMHCHKQCIGIYSRLDTICSPSDLHPHPNAHRLRRTVGGPGRMQRCDEERDKKKRASAELTGSQLLLGCCLLLAMSCNCQFILSQAFHHCSEPGWRKPLESLRNLLAASH